MIAAYDAEYIYGIPYADTIVNARICAASHIGAQVCKSALKLWLKRVAMRCMSRRQTIQVMVVMQWIYEETERLN